jgi:magnesium transporter
MISATFTGAIISHFEGALASAAILTVFMPMVMGTGGNAGGQSSVTIIRALSLGEVEFSDAFRVILKESIVGIICGLTLSICNFFKLLWFDRVGVMVSLVVCLALFLTVLFAKIIGAILPILADKIKLDPAVMANPIITTIVDAGSLFVYFQVASILLGL